MDPSLDPQNFSTIKKLHATFASWLAVFTLMFALTVATPVIPILPMALNTTQVMANFAFSAPFLGVFFAPLYTPHISEAIGRKWFYVTSLTLLLGFIAAISQAKAIKTLITLRVLAGFFGGPLAVLVEGIHADVWPSERTLSYYCSVALAQYWGAAFGPIIGAQALQAGGVPWTAYSALIVGGIAWVFVITMPETFARRIQKRQRANNPSIPPLPPATTGDSFGEGLHLTVIDPLVMLFTQPLVIMGALQLGLAFGVVFQFFISVPFVLKAVYGVTSAMSFFAAVGGSAMAFFTCLVLGIATEGARAERRLIGAMFGSLFTTAGIFWIARTAKPTIPIAIPVTGTAIYVWGNMSIVISIISYFFDAFSPEGVLSALTAMACFRIASALLIPIFILNMFGQLTPPWALSVFGFIGVAFIPFPFIMYFFGERMRLNSRFTDPGARPPPLVKHV